MPSRKDPKVLPKVLERSRTQRSCAGTAKKSHRASDCCKKQRENDKEQSKGFEERRQQRKRQQEGVQGQVLQVWQNGSHVDGLQIRKKRVQSKLAKKAWQRPGVSTWRASILNALEIGAVQLPEEDHKIRTGTDSCASVTVFPKSVADDYPMLHTPGPASGKFLPGSGCAKGAGQAQRWVSAVREPESGGHAQSFDGGVRDERHGTRRVLPQERQHQGVCIPRGQWHEAGTRESGRSVRLVPYSKSTSKNSTSDPYSSHSALEQIEEMMVSCEGGPRKLTGACCAASPME